MPELRKSLGAVVREIHERGGQAVVCEAHFVAGLSDDTAEDLFREASDKDYAAIAEQARHLASTVRRVGVLSDARRRSVAQKLDRLKQRFQEVAAKDLFGSGGREKAAGLLSLVEDRLQGVEVAGRSDLDLSRPPKGATWVTRNGVMVDRIASSWLIRKFIDPSARFRFVAARGYKPARGELRFDMAGAEFTHEGDRCTFEVLLERFAIRDSALRCVAEIVHDLDLEDAKYARPEAAGVGRMIVGLALANAKDEARVIQGGAFFDNLYASFGRRSPSPQREE